MPITKPVSATKSASVPSAESQSLLLEFMGRVLVEHKKFNQYHSKLKAVDVAYARYKEQNRDENGLIIDQGTDAATTQVGAVGMSPTTPPVVVSQVDSMVAYLTDVFLSGVPLFPVVSNPANVKEAEGLETMLDDHAQLGGYVRQLLLFLKDGVKYNFSAVEALWTSIDQYSLDQELLSPGSQRNIAKKVTKYTKVTRWDPYNTIWDHNVNPGDVSADGDYAGNVAVLSRTKLKRKLIRMGIDGESFNTKEAIGSSIAGQPETLAHYVIPPQISNYIDARRPIDGINWFQYLTGKADPNGAQNTAGNYEVVTIYARLIPKEFKLVVPAPNTVQIWKLTSINGNVLVEARRIISAFDNIPVFFGQPLEDGLGFQTQSVAEGAIPFQEAAATMLNIRFNSARRAVSDRALYDASLIKPTDINAPVPAAKIPVTINSLGNKTLSDAYQQIPFDPRGTENALQDGILIAGFAKDMAGLNNVQQGKFQKGNKSVVEFERTVGNSDNILRMPALVLEHQVFAPLKATLKLNIFQFGEDAEVVSQKNGNVNKVKIEELRKKVLAFRLADGYTPKSKLASTEFITALLQQILSSEFMAAQFGSMVPGMIVHLAQLQGVRGLEQYLPAQPQAQGQPAPEGDSNAPPAEGATPATT